MKPPSLSRPLNESLRLTLLLDLACAIGMLTTMAFAWPELSARQGWWPKPLGIGLGLFWAGMMFANIKTTDRIVAETFRRFKLLTGEGNGERGL